MKRIDLSEHARNPAYYNRDRDMEVALAWNAIKKTLAEVGREELFWYIKSVRLTDKNVVIQTEKPSVNSEIRFFEAALLKRITTSLRALGNPPNRWIRFR